MKLHPMGAVRRYDCRSPIRSQTFQRKKFRTAAIQRRGNVKLHPMGAVRRYDCRSPIRSQTFQRKKFRAAAIQRRVLKKIRRLI
ncbi:MAG: hypothetical protein IKD80_00485 [Selenomonadaceae bacterium]|nr:hypothetical protein [Selenomonadaceae bacterium]